MITAQTSSYIPQLREYLKGQPIVRAWLFGSCSRGEETEQSDLDLLVQYDDSSRLVNIFAIASIAKDIEHLIGRRVDLIEDGDLLPFATASATHDKILIYERDCQ